MKPKSFSATALTVAEMCMARYKAEQIDRTPGIQNTAASLGSSVHGALEMYVKVVYLEKSQRASIKLLLELFRMSYMTTYSTADCDTEEYADGVDMLNRWFMRDHIGENEVVTCEVKKNFPIKTTIGDIPFNYILDRFDKIGPNEYRVVDYKTNRAGVRPEDLRKKIQPRAYALAMQIEHPDAERIWVEFDMLRHDGPVGIVFTKTDNMATWRFMKEKAKQIINTPDDKVKETLNPECNYCIRKMTCELIRKNIAGGGVFTVSSAAEAVDIRAELEYQRKAVEASINELDNIILADAKQLEVFEFTSAANKLEIVAGSRRSIDPDRAQLVLGDALWKKYGSGSITLAVIEKLIKGTEIDDKQKSQLKGLIFSKRGEPKVKVSAANPIDED